MAHVEGLRRVEERVIWLRRAFANTDQTTRERLLECVHTRERFRDYAADATELSERDARLVVANEAGYPFWRGYETFLYLAPAVQQVRAAARVGELRTLQALLGANPGAANARWVRGWVAQRVPIEAIPLNVVALGVFEGTNGRGNDYQLAHALMRAGADIEFDNGGPSKPNQEVPGLDRLGGTVLHALTAGVPFGASRDSHDYDERRIPLI